MKHRAQALSDTFTMSDELTTSSAGALYVHPLPGQRSTQPCRISVLEGDPKRRDQLLKFTLWSSTRTHAAMRTGAAMK
jgi:hypothetical protein